MKRERIPEATVEAAIVLIALGLAFVAAFAGWAVGHATRSGTKTVAAATGPPPPPGHRGGPNLPVAAIGNSAHGAQLWEEKRCSDCHSLHGKGGRDGPPLDFMRGHLSAREIADMSGEIWDHLPMMLHHFKEEGLPVPTFKEGEMADLIAYLHGGRPTSAPASPATP